MRGGFKKMVKLAKFSLFFLSSNSQKLVNYRLFQDPVTRHFYIRDNKFPTIASLVEHYKKYPLNEQVTTEGSLI